MKLLFVSFTFFLLGSAYSQDQGSYSLKQLKGGDFKKDTSYIYWLPFQKGNRYLLIQGYDSKMSHSNELALDFKMKQGSKICAAREGIVIGMREDSDKGGLKNEYLSEGNYVIILHPDGTEANYWHIQTNGAVVNIGDTVKKGQLIALSGNTGYTAFPHLHFEVVPANSNKGYKNFYQLPTRFYTKKGIRYLKPAKYYKCVHR